MKQCFKCSELLPLAEFYKHPRMADGRSGKCKACVSAAAKKLRVERLTTGINEVEFWRLVDRGGPDECWIWLAGKDAGGYGQFRRRYTHRISWALVSGEIPEGMFILHSCDNRSCVNPAHLSPGTAADNAQDMVSRGRQTSGVRNAMAKLTDLDVGDIRRVYAAGEKGQRDIAAAYGINKSAVSRIINRKRWAHI